MLTSQQLATRLVLDWQVSMASWAETPDSEGIPSYVGLSVIGVGWWRDPWVSGSAGVERVGGVGPAHQRMQSAVLRVLARFVDVVRAVGGELAISDGLIDDLAVAVEYDDVCVISLSAVRCEADRRRRVGSWHALVAPHGFLLLPSCRCGSVRDLGDATFVVGAEFGGRFPAHRDRLRCLVEPAQVWDPGRVLGQVSTLPDGRRVVDTGDGVAELLWRPNRHLDLRVGDWVSVVVAGPPDTCFEVRPVLRPDRVSVSGCSDLT